jgi:hypothetical protein
MQNDRSARTGEALYLATVRVPDRNDSMIIASKRIAVALSLAGYLLATTAIHLLHDHAAHCGHAELSSSTEGCHDAPSHGAAGHHEHSPPSDCEDSCFACRFVAAKTILPAVVLPVERFETVCQVEPQQPVFTPVTQVECSLCRGPPAAC